MPAGIGKFRCTGLSLAAAVVLAAVVSLLPAQELNARRPTVRQADHLVIETGDARPLFDLFTAAFELPVAWRFVDSPSFTGGGFGTGNFNVEIIQGPDRAVRARYTSLALEPYSLPECIEELKGRGIAFNPPEPHIAKLPDGTQGPLWTIVMLTELARPGMGVFLYAHSAKYLNVHVRRNQMAGELALRKGGPLGIASVREVVITTADFRRDVSRWQKLLFPVPQSPAGTWKLGNGPLLHLVPGNANRIERMIFGVRSLEQTRLRLQQDRMLGSATPAEVSMNPARIQGLSIRFKEK